jgi:NAD(P) transhydrogenase subunit alpha
MIVGIPKETHPGERRVALVPAALPALAKAGIKVLIETGAGVEAGFADRTYSEKEAEIATGRAELFTKADVICAVRGLGSNPEAGRADLPLMRRDQVVIGMLDPLAATESAKELAATGVTAFAMELMPRITRAQSMDVLSAMATIAGYKGVLLAAVQLPRMFPMMMTAAGTLTPARVLVMGVGVAGLQAIATARRLGASVEAYDIRPAVKEQVLSVGAKFVELRLDTGDAEDKGGYASPPRRSPASGRRS